MASKQTNKKRRGAMNDEALTPSRSGASHERGKSSMILKLMRAAACASLTRQLCSLVQSVYVLEYIMLCSMEPLFTSNQV